MSFGLRKPGETHHLAGEEPSTLLQPNTETPSPTAQELPLFAVPNPKSHQVPLETPSVSCSQEHVKVSNQVKSTLSDGNGFI